LKIILSRKGFDSANGGVPSPILPDGTMLSMPIPSKDALRFRDLCCGGHTYEEILRQLAPKRTFETCHLDPDIKADIRAKTVPNWKPAFGQVGSAQGYLENQQVGPGDLFLFFGRFQKTLGDIANGTLHFDKQAPIIHVIYGYMEIGALVPNDKIAKNDYLWHPHGFETRLYNETNNVLYLPAEQLSFDSNRSGWGIVHYAEKRVLTMSNKTATWKEIPALMPDNISGNKNNSTKGGGIFYQGIWQEMVLKENDLSEEWAKSMLL